MPEMPSKSRESPYLCADNPVPAQRFKQKPMPGTIDQCPAHIASLITSGGDERITTDAGTGSNKYFVNPAEVTGRLNRGSCTCSTLNRYSLERLMIFHERLAEEGFEKLRREQVSRLKTLLNYEGEDKFEIFFAPSGSDLSYLPLLMAGMLYPGKKIHNLLTCPEELGTGTQIAALGRYFMQANQFGEEMPYRDLLSEDIDIEVSNFPARDIDGRIMDHNQELRAVIRAHSDQARIGNLVIGSKSGIENNLNILFEVEDEMLWVVDLCQFRNSKRLVNKLLDLNCMIMLTGSKFYQSPPFCGLMLVPRQIIRRLQSASGPVAATFTRLFSRQDIPETLPDLRRQFRDFHNEGLMARWECAISEMEAYDAIPRQVAQEMITTWNSFVRQELISRPIFELMPNQEQTNKSIISFRVRCQDRYLDHEELRRVFEAVVTDSHNTLSGPYHKIFIGQPVAYADKSFIRLALGSYDLRQLLDSGGNLDNDRTIIDILEQKALELCS
jgi:hypothetical protein